MVTGPPWKHNLAHEVGEEVMLDVQAPEPSFKPEGVPLPPMEIAERVKEIRNFYVEVRDVDPAEGGIGFTDGCKGCIAITMGKQKTDHGENCRLRVIEKSFSKPDVAARVKVSRARETEWHAKKLEEEDTKKAAKESDEKLRSSLSEPPTVRGFESDEQEGRKTAARFRA